MTCAYTSSHFILNNTGIFCERYSVYTHIEYSQRANMFVILLFGVLYCATGQPYQRVWSADWDEIPDAVGGHVKYENGSFGFKGYGWVDKNKDWEVGTNFNWRFRRALQKMNLKKVCFKQFCTNYLGIQTIMPLRIIPTPWEITLVECYASPSDFENGGFM